jgi:hypothetical protein
MKSAAFADVLSIQESGGHGNAIPQIHKRILEEAIEEFEADNVEDVETL